MKHSPDAIFMKPTLAAIAGPLKGSSFVLEQEVITVGRDLSNTLPIGDASVSRRHSALTADSSSYRISDVESLNGTIVNGVPVKELVLRHGDQVEIGNSLFVYLLHPDDLSPAERAGPDAEKPLSFGSTVRLRPDQALYGAGGTMQSALAPDSDAGRIARDLEILLKASRVFPSAPSVAELGMRLIDLAMEGVPAERGALVSGGNDGEEPLAVATRTEFPDASSFSFSRTIVARVIADREAILSNDILENESLAGAGSVAGAGIRAFAAVPLLAGDRVEAVLYLDSRIRDSSLAETHLQLLMGLANIASAALANIRRIEWLETERRLLAESSSGSQMVGESPEMDHVRQFVTRVAPAEVTVLILGESGTGKEMAAQAIHSASPRSERAFVAINCAALSETLLESELFGHERGAFTGAIAQKKGRLEIADGGTVFLDEIAELPMPVQARLLRVLQEREFERVGGTRTIRVDVRLLAATNRDLEEAMRSGRFREDLFYRLNVVSFTLPPLRQRRADITLLATYFAAKFARKFNKKIHGISATARACLLDYDWPGNIRELSNAIERAVVLGEGDVIAPEDLPESLVEKAPSGVRERLADYHSAVNEAKKDVIQRAVEESGGRYTEAARKLGIHPNYLHRLIRNLDLKSDLKS